MGTLCGSTATPLPHPSSSERSSWKSVLPQLSSRAITLSTCRRSELRCSFTTILRPAQAFPSLTGAPSMTRLMSAVRVKGDEGGFTLLETMIVLAVMSIVTGGIAAGLIVTWRNDDSSFQRLAKSHDAQLLATYLVNDAQSAGINGSPAISLSDTVTCSDAAVAGTP